MKISEKTRFELESFNLELRENRFGKWIVQSRDWPWSLPVGNEAEVLVVLARCQAVSDRGELLSRAPREIVVSLPQLEPPWDPRNNPDDAATLAEVAEMERENARRAE